VLFLWPDGCTLTRVGDDDQQAQVQTPQSHCTATVRPLTAVFSHLDMTEYGLNPYDLRLSDISPWASTVQYREPYNDGYTAVLYGNGAQPYPYMHYGPTVVAKSYVSFSPQYS
jgi:hypothetical protein